MRVRGEVWYHTTMPSKCGLTGLVIAYNEASRIGAALGSLAFCDERIVVDSGSTDGTADLARALGARVVERAFTDFGEQKAFGSNLASYDWILNLDADEILSPAAVTEITVLREAGFEGPAVAYSLPFRNYFRSAWVRSAGYYPDHHVRLFRRDRSRWDRGAGVHEVLCADGPIGRLRGAIDHASFRSLQHFVEKSNRYAAVFAAHAYREGRRSGWSAILGHTAYRFFRAYVLRGGFREGALGLTIAGLQAYEVFQKYARLWELGRFPEARAELSDEVKSAS